MQYNTSQPRLIISEYGRNIQKMIEFACSVEQKEERNKVASAIIQVMGQLNPHLRDVTDFKHKLWDHLFIISDFKLDVDSPYPMPSKETFISKPDRVKYQNNNIKYKHYGKTVELLIEKAIAYQDGPEKDALIGSIANLMKKSYLNWNRDSVNDDMILAHLSELSDGKLKVSDTFRLSNTNDILAKNIVRKKIHKNDGKRTGNFGRDKHQQNNNFRKKY